MKRSIAVTFCSVVVMVILCWGFYQVGYQNGSRSKETRLAPVENQLTKWVYSKSTKISEATARTIVKEALKTDRPLLILAMAATESEFVPSATSSAGAVGVMQVMSKYHLKDLVSAKIVKEARDLYDIAPSIKAGNFIMGKFLKETNGNVQKALDKYLGSKDGPYVRAIQSNLSDLYVLVGA